MEKDLERNYLVILAALLNDIGIFEQKLSEGIEQDYKKFSISFFNKFVKDKTCLRDGYADTILEIMENKNSDVINKLELANQLDYLESSVQTKVPGKIKPLVSILSQVQINENKPLPEGLYYYSPCILEKKAIFPNYVKNSTDLNLATLKQDYETLFDNFLKESYLLPNSDLKSLIDNLLYLFEKYLCYVPINNGDELTDISLFDHIKTVTALTSCLINSKEEKPFLIIAADISGIQNFIYTEQSPVENSTKGLGKRLRGKSFYLSLLTDIFAERYLELFGLTRANILINGGGHFVIIVPNNDINKAKLQQETKKIQRWFYRQYKGELNLIVESIEANDELYSNFNKWYNDISSRLQKAKKQRSFDALDEVFNYNLDKLDVSEYRDQIEYEDYQIYESINTTYEKNLYGLSKLFENIGKILPKSKYLIQINTGSNIKAKLGSDLFYIPFSEFNIYWIFAEKSKEITNLFDALNSTDITNVRILKINDTNIYDLVYNNQLPLTIGYRFIGTEVPKDGKDILEFEKIAELNYEKTNISNDKLDYPLLGTLRMDVDNLGSIFGNGLEKKKNGRNLKTLTRIVSLSRMFNMFFCGYLNETAKKWGMYITYSGGDDLFVVGSWLNSISFAEELRAEFSRFVCNNKNVTISGGLFLSKGNYPIGKAARHAGEAEDNAKRCFEDKDCISAFGKEFKWADFNKYLLYGKELEQLVISNNSEESVNKSFIHRILQITNEIYEDPQKINIKYFEKIALIKYLFARAPRKIDNKKIELLKSEPDKVNKKIKLLGKLILEDSQDYLRNFLIPATYIILKHRSSKK